MNRFTFAILNICQLFIFVIRDYAEASSCDETARRRATFRLSRAFVISEADRGSFPEDARGKPVGRSDVGCRRVASSRLRLIIVELISRSERQPYRENVRQIVFMQSHVPDHERLRRRGQSSAGAASYTPLTGIGQKLKQLAQFLARKTMPESC